MIKHVTWMKELQIMFMLKHNIFQQKQAGLSLEIRKEK